jgi:hypothetical protein
MLCCFSGYLRCSTGSNKPFNIVAVINSYQPVSENQPFICLLVSRGASLVVVCRILKVGNPAFCTDLRTRTECEHGVNRHLSFIRWACVIRFSSLNMFEINYAAHLSCRRYRHLCRCLLRNDPVPRAFSLGGSSVESTTTPPSSESGQESQDEAQQQQQQQFQHFPEK